MKLTKIEKKLRKFSPYIVSMYGYLKEKDKWFRVDTDNNEKVELEEEIEEIISARFIFKNISRILDITFEKKNMQDKS